MAAENTNLLDAMNQARDKAMATQPASDVESFLRSGAGRKELARILGDDEMATRWMRIALTECRRNPDLFECSMASFAGALMQAAAVKLEPGPPLGLSWILPFKDGRSGRREATFVAGYPGVIQLAMRSGQLRDVAAREVCEEDEFEPPDYGRPGAPFLHKMPTRGRRGDAYGYYCVIDYANGGRHVEYRTREQIEDHRDRFSRAAGSARSPWRTDFDAMARKTVVLQARRYLPASIEFQMAMAADERVTRWEPERGLSVDDIDLAPDAAAVPEQGAEEPNGEEESE